LEFIGVSLAEALMSESINGTTAESWGNQRLVSVSVHHGYSAIDPQITKHVLE
jgi:hypothetical protein